jgi:TRAP-type mannitol/chloroaromatic compound transport system permease small subunit
VHDVVRKLYNLIANVGRTAIASVAAPLRLCIRLVDALNDWTGYFVGWLCSGLIGVVCVDVFMRYVLDRTVLAVQELEWHLVAVIFLMGAAYTFKHDRHVRVDIIYAGRSKSWRAWTNLIGCLLFLLPLCSLIIYESYDFVVNSWHHSEGSGDPGGLPFRYALKAIIPLSFAFLFLQGLAVAGKSLLVLGGIDRGPADSPDTEDSPDITLPPVGP